MLKVLNTPKAPAAIGPYSQAIVLNNILFSSGQIPADPETGAIVGSDITGQAEQVMKNVKACLLYTSIQSISVYGIWSAKKRGAFCFLRPSWAVEIPLTIKVRLWVKSKIYV